MTILHSSFSLEAAAEADRLAIGLRGNNGVWVKSGHPMISAACPLYPQKQTLVARRFMSALCQKRTCHKFKGGSQCDFKSVR